MDLLSKFRVYLQNQAKPASNVTAKNYLADVRKFIFWIERRLGSSFSPELVTPQLIEDFKQSNAGAASSIERNISSLRKFFHFLVLEGILGQSPFDQNQLQKTLIEHDPFRLKDFKNYLYVYNASPHTIKNYLVDIKSFADWLKKVTTNKNSWEVKEENILSKVDSKTIEEYKLRIMESSAPRTVNRKLSSIRKYLKWAEDEGIIKGQVEGTENLRVSLQTKRTNVGISSKEEPKVTSYSKFPPLRVIQKTFQTLEFTFDLMTITPLALGLRKLEILSWRIKGKPVFESVKSKSKKVKNLPKELFAPLEISTDSLPLHKKLFHHLRYTRPKWYLIYHRYSFTHYLHFGILVLAVSLIGFNLYLNYFQKSLNTNVLGVTNPKSPPRILSFQGRLTDASDNPIITATNLRFGIYDSATGTGSALLWQEVQNVTPDADGVFSVLLGTKSTMQQTLFAEHAGLWLGVTVGTTAELTPRQQLASVAYAENAETLQGLPPITDPGAGTNNVVLALDSSGNLTIGGTATPKFQATGGKFTLSGNVLTLTTLSGSNSNIELNPDGRSFIDLQKPLQNTTNNNNISTALGAVEVNDLFAILATSSGQSAFTVDQNGAGPIISASASGTAKFTVSNTGAGTFADDLAVNGGDITSTATSFNLLNSTVTTLNIGGAATTINLGATSGTTTTANSLTILGNTTVGDAAADTISLVGAVNSNILPDANNTRNLGSSSLRWNTVYGTNGDFTNISGNITGGSTTSSSWTVNSDNATANAEIGSLAFETGTAAFNAALQWNALGDAGRVTGFDNTNLFNFPIGIYSQVSGANQTFTSGTLFKYGQPAVHAITQSGAFVGTDYDFSSNITVPNSTSGNQTGFKTTLKDGGASATAIGFQTAGTLDYGIDLGGTIGTAEIRLSNAETIDNLTNGTINLGTTTLKLTGGTTLVSDQTTFNLFNTTTTTLNLGGAATTLSLGASTGTTTVNNALTVTGNFSQSGSSTFSTGTGAISLNGATTVTSPSSSSVALTVKGATSQSVDLLQLKNSLDAVIAKVDQLGNITGNTLTSTVSTGTAPLTVSSTTQVSNLNVSQLEGYTASNLYSQPQPNLVLNSDFSRRNKWMTFMPEVFADTSGWTLASGSSIGTVASNILTSGNTGNWSIRAGLSTWRDARFSAQWKKVQSDASFPTWEVGKWVDSNNWVASVYTSGQLRIYKNISGSLSQVGTGVTASLTDNNWYWLELEAQGTKYIAKIYSSGASPVSKSSSTLVTTKSEDVTDSAFTNGGYIVIGSGLVGGANNTVATQWGGLATGDGGVYVEGWGPESWAAPTFTGTKGGQAIGFDEAADSGPIGKQWAMRAYIPAASRGIDLDQFTPDGTVAPSTTYTASTYIKTSGKGGTGDLINAIGYSYQSDGTTNLQNAILVDAGETAWTQKTGAITGHANARRGRFRFQINPNLTATGTVFFSLPQIEQGAIATPWRNAPADDGPIVWITPVDGVGLADATTTNGSYTEMDSRSFASNVLLPWDASVEIETDFVAEHSAANSRAGYNATVDGTVITQGGSSNFTYWFDTAGRYVSVPMRRISKQTAGKHRIAIQHRIVDAGTLTSYINSVGASLKITATRGKFDLAEEYSVEDQSIEAGDVVRLSPSGGTVVEKVNGGYQQDILGIISTDPGITLSSTVELNGYREKPNLRPVALSGRVPVKATTENGPIYRGDTLTSSATKPGFAMKATKAGKSIGVAMEELYDGQGQIMTFVNLSWYDPDVYLANTGEFKIDKIYTSNTAIEQNCEQNTDSSEFGLVAVCPRTDIIGQTYKVISSAGDAVERIGVFGSAFVGVLKAGVVETKDIIAENITVESKIISPVAEIKEIQADTITPLSSDKVVIRLEDNSATPSAASVPKLEIQNASGSAVASIDDQGNASFSGTLNSFGLISESASISGTLRTKNLIADNIESQVAGIKTLLSNLTIEQASSSAAIDIASYSAELANVDTLQAQVGTFVQGLFAIGPTSLSDATVFGQFSVGGNLILADSSINVLGQDLQIQPLAQGGVSFLAGKVQIDTSGNLTIEGNTTIKGTLFTNVIAPVPGSNVIEFKTATGSAVATIDNDGTATFKKLNLSLVEPAFALSETEFVATGSAGIATISAQQNQLTILNKLVTEKSLIYITPVGTSSAQTPYLLRQEPGESFTIGGSENSTFNWLIIN